MSSTRRRALTTRGEPPGWRPSTGAWWTSSARFRSMSVGTSVGEPLSPCRSLAPGHSPDDPDSHGFSLAGLRGLSEDEAAGRLARDGPNELPSQRSRGLFTVVREVVREPMFQLLVAAGLLYLMMGKLSDALLLLSFVFVVIAITVIQERRTERALDALRDLSSPRALVVRDGVQRRIAGRDVVAGDTVILSEGDRVPADAILRRSAHLAVDESALTGESVPVRKRPST